MEITPTIGQQAPAKQTTANTKISSDFDTFLKMLTAQIQNQDPLNPIHWQIMRCNLQLFLALNSKR